MSDLSVAHRSGCGCGGIGGGGVVSACLGKHGGSAAGSTEPSTFASCNVTFALPLPALSSTSLLLHPPHYSPTTMLRTPHYAFCSKAESATRQRRGSPPISMDWDCFPVYRVERALLTGGRPL